MNGAGCAEIEIDASGGEQKLVIQLRPTLDDLHIEAVALVCAVGERLIEAAMLGFGEPIGREGDTIERQRVRSGAEKQKCGERAGISHSHASMRRACASTSLAWPC